MADPENTLAGWSQIIQGMRRPKFTPHYHLVIQVDDLGGGDVDASAPLATRDDAEAYRGGWQAAINMVAGLLPRQDGDLTPSMLGALTPVIITALTQCKICEHPEEHRLIGAEIIGALDTSPMNTGGAVPHPDECPHCARSFGYCDYHGATSRTKTL